MNKGKSRVHMLVMYDRKQYRKTKPILEANHQAIKKTIKHLKRKRKEQKSGS